MIIDTVQSIIISSRLESTEQGKLLKICNLLYFMANKCPTHIRCNNVIVKSSSTWRKVRSRGNTPFPPPLTYYVITTRLSPIFLHVCLHYCKDCLASRALTVRIRAVLTGALCSLVAYINCRERACTCHAGSWRYQWRISAQFESEASHHLCWLSPASSGGHRGNHFKQATPTFINMSAYSIFMSIF